MRAERVKWREIIQQLSQTAIGKRSNVHKKEVLPNFQLFISLVASFHGGEGCRPTAMWALRKIQVGQMKSRQTAVMNSQLTKDHNDTCLPWIPALSWIYLWSHVIPFSYPPNCIKSRWIINSSLFILCTKRNKSNEVRHSAMEVGQVEEPKKSIVVPIKMSRMWNKKPKISNSANVDNAYS